MQKIHGSGTIPSYVDNLYFTENAVKIIEKIAQKRGDAEVQVDVHFDRSRIQRGKGFRCAGHKHLTS